MLFRFSNQGVYVQEFYGETRENKKQHTSYSIIIPTTAHI